MNLNRFDCSVWMISKKGVIQGWGFADPKHWDWDPLDIIEWHFLVSKTCDVRQFQLVNKCHLVIETVDKSMLTKTLSASVSDCITKLCHFCQLFYSYKSATRK